MGINGTSPRGHSPLCVLRFIAPMRAPEWVFGTLVLTLLGCDGSSGFSTTLNSPG